MRIFLYVLLFIIMSPGFFFHIAAPKSKTILLKSVIIHAFLFTTAAYILSIVVQMYPQLDGFVGSNILDSITRKLKEVVEAIKRPFKAPEPVSASGSLPPPMQPEQPMQKSIQYTRNNGRVGASELPM
jgi:hypothetical protein